VTERVVVATESEEPPPQAVSAAMAAAVKANENERFVKSLFMEFSAGV
jgi:hypothetical protein